MAKLERKAYATYVDANFGTGTKDWFLIGKDIEDMSVELNSDTETVKNILGENAVKDNGYAPSVTADPYYANPDDGAIYTKLKDIAMNRLKGDDCKSTILEVIIDDDDTSNLDAWTEDVLIKPTSYGGGTEGVNIPFDIVFAGNRKQVKVEISEGTIRILP